MMMDCNCATKRKAEVAAGEECGCAKRREVEEPASQGENTEAPRKGMLRIPQTKIEWILSLKKPRPVRMDVYESVDDPELMEIVRDMAMAREQHWASMCELQQWVRSEYAAKGYVEVGEEEEGSVELAAPLPPFFADTGEGELEEEEDGETPEAPDLMVMDA